MGWGESGRKGVQPAHGAEQAFTAVGERRYMLLSFHPFATLGASAGLHLASSSHL